jgi:peroxiredoxin family protein
MSWRILSKNGFEHVKVDPGGVGTYLGDAEESNVNLFI